MAGEKSSKLLKLTNEEKLLRHNLETRRYWTERDKPDHGVFSHVENGEQKMPAVWKMTKGVTLYDWQEECVNKWFLEKRGTIKVVTGAGKTILALAIIERLQAENKDLRVAIVVPTIVLQNQWYDEILRNSNLPPYMIGKLGGDHRDKFDEEKRILICVLNSAAAYLPKMVADTEVGGNLLLVADECHKAGASYMQRVFKTKRSYNLGLSATPEREDHYEGSSGFLGYDETILGKELGSIIYELTVREALEQGILPEFEIHHYGLPLGESEREKYQNLSRRIRDLGKEIKELGHQKGIHDSNIIRRMQVLANREDELGSLARQHLYLTNQRKHLLYNSKARQDAVLKILAEEFKEDSETRALLFHESIESVMLLYHHLLQANYPAAVEHSQLPDSVRKESIELFRQGTAQVIVSARSLIEGFNVPETDIGIIAASSTSVRQRIQTIGRLLRKSEGKKETAVIYVLYMKDTIDEYIYGKTDWDNLLGAQRNRYFTLNSRGELQEQKEAPRTPLPREEDLASEELEIGGEYPGAYEGREYTSDSDGNVFTSGDELIENPQGVPELIKRIRGGYGRFKVTAKKGYVLVQVLEDEEWLIKFAGSLKEPFRKAALPAAGTTEVEPVPAGLAVGDPFPAESVSKDAVAIYLRQNRGRLVLAKKEGRGWRFARLKDRAADYEKGLAGSNLLEAALEYRRSYPQLSKMLQTKEGHVVVLKDGEYKYIATLKSGLEFP